MDKIMWSAFTLFSIGWFAYILLYFSVLLHELGHYLAGRFAGLRGSHIVEMGGGDRRLEIRFLGATLSLGWIPTHFGAYRVLPPPEKLSSRKQALIASAGPVTNFLVSTLAFGLYHYCAGGKSSAEDIASLLSLPLLSFWTLVFDAQNNPIHALSGLPMGLYLIGLINSAVFWLSAIPIPLTFSDGMYIWQIIMEHLRKSRANEARQGTTPN